MLKVNEKKELNKKLEIIRAHQASPNLSARRIAKLCDTSKSNVLRVLKSYRTSGLSYDEIKRFNTKELIQLFYHKVKQQLLSKREPNWDECIAELLKPKGKTKTVTWLQYVEEEPATAFGKSWFFEKLRKIFKANKISMRQHYAGGEVVLIDYAGTKVRVWQNGKEVWCKVFVACLGASRKIFALVTPAETTKDWLRGLEELFKTIGGVPEVIVIDNAKALVTKPGPLPVLNKNLQLFAEHFNCNIDTCRVATPEDKGPVENAVRTVTQRVIQVMNNDHKFFSLDEANLFMAKEVEKLNQIPMQKLKISRSQLFKEIEKPALKPLPTQPCPILFDYKYVQVPEDYHIGYKQHWYSVPYQLANHKVEVLVDISTLKIVHENTVQAVHQLNNEVDGQTTLPEHLHPRHKAESLKTQDQYQAWAEGIDQSVVSLVEELYSQSKNPKSRAIGKKCQALQKLCSDHGAEAFVKACQYAVEHHMVEPTDIKLILSAHRHEHDFSTTGLPQVQHQHIRGSSYYGGPSHE